MTTVQTADLQGAALDWAVAKCEGRKEPAILENFKVAWYSWGNVHYSTKWALGGPIIEREQIELRYDDGIWSAAHPLIRPKSRWWRNGPTPLIAAMRCYVASKLGDEVEIPEELR